MILSADRKAVLDSYLSSDSDKYRLIRPTNPDWQDADQALILLLNGLASQKTLHVASGAH
jgi:hypothetical protein